MEWNKLSDERKRTILNQVAAQKGLPTQAIEKDWWVTQCLRVIFQSKVAPHIIFKGGTSLSKGWNLIERFSEDIDLSMSREYLGFQGELSISQIKKLRKRSCAFVTDELSTIVKSGLQEMGVPDLDVELTVPPSENSDTDPQTIFVGYKSLVPELAYLPSKVKIEVGARALMEPVEVRPIRSFVAEVFPEASFADSKVDVATVLPKRTFLEKVFLLHETMAASPEKVGDRMARHLYDLERLMDTTHGTDAVADRDLFERIANFRRHYNTIKNVDYNRHKPDQIAIIPPDFVKATWEKDYATLQASMIYGETQTFDKLMKRMVALQERFRGLPEA
jgi:hypothetical protein